MFYWKFPVDLPFNSNDWLSMPWSFSREYLLLVLTRNEGVEEQSIKLLSFDIFYTKFLGVNSSKSALSESGSIDM